MFRYLLPLLLALCSPCWGQDTATDFIKSDLIHIVFPAEGVAVPAGESFVVQTPPNLEFTITPAPVFSLKSTQDGTGNKLLMVMKAQPPGYTITIDHVVIHPTEEETKSAPWDDRAKFADWLKKNSKDEVYQDSHFVQVGKGPDPPVPPNPPNPPDPPPSNFDSLTKAVAALAKDLPASERATVKAVYETTGKEPYTTIKERASVTSTALQTALGLNAYDDWYSFRFGLAQELTKLKASGVLTESNHAQCWKAIAEGLK